MLQPTPLALAMTIFMAGASFIFPAQAEETPTRLGEDDAGVYSVSVENDIFTGSDSSYTNGVRFAYVSPEGDVPVFLEDLAHSLPFFNKSGHKRWGLALGQSIYTPSNIKIRNAQSNDQPYAGWLYGTASITSNTDKTLDTFEVTLGMVGPASGAEHTQETVHDFINSPHPMGWQHQLHNEPGLILAYDHKWRALYQFSPFGWAVDITPSAGAMVGNIFTQVNVGAVARFGKHLPQDYGPPLIQPNVSGSEFFIPTSEVGWYVFAGLEGHAVARNIFLDGNTFRDSPSVDKKHFVGGIQAGAAITWEDFRLSYTHVFKSEEFENQENLNQYGAVTLAMRF